MRRAESGGQFGAQAGAATPVNAASRSTVCRRSPWSPWTGETIRRSTPAAASLETRSATSVLAADQRGRVDELLGDRRVGVLALAVQEQRLDLVGDVAEPEAVGEVDVEVGLARAHSAEVEQQAHLDHRARRRPGRRRSRPAATARPRGRRGFARPSRTRPRGARPRSARTRRRRRRSGSSRRRARPPSRPTCARSRRRTPGSRCGPGGS